MLKHSQWQILNKELPCIQTRVPLHCSVSDCLHKVQEEEIHADEFTKEMMKEILTPPRAVCRALGKSRMKSIVN